MNHKRTKKKRKNDEVVYSSWYSDGLMFFAPFIVVGLLICPFMIWIWLYFAL
jgi:hypothetical protein